jgi:uncharacterized repeat protein (TIGR03803 family)
MKKNYILICILFYIGIEIAKGQYTKLLEFNGSNGSQPFGSVILSDNDSVLYGMTNGNTLFSVHTDGTSYQILHTFTTDASFPYGSLIRSGNALYGMTSQGGFGYGTIFTINTDGSGYNVLYNFKNDSINDFGANPVGTLTISGNVLYGMTYGGGSNYGNVFSIHTDGSAYTDLLIFNGTNGQFPGYGALVLSGGILYGTTLYGGTSGGGVLFSIDTNGTGYNKLIDFNITNGERPFGSVTLSGNVLYGNTNGGGIYNKGTLYSIHSDGTGYSKLVDFNGSNGQSPMGSLTLSNNLLYGTTGSGGTNNLGIVFSIDTSGTGMQTLFDFNSATGSQPRATLSFSETTLYGTTVIGGTYDDGVIFSLEIHPADIPICMVSADDNSNNNLISWEKPITTDIDSFIVYRETTTNNYQPIGALPYSATSEFIDTVRFSYFPFTGNPNAGTYRYKIQVKDTSGNYSSLSPYHNTIFITKTGGTFNWNQYEIEGQPTSVSSYILYRDDNSTGLWHSVAGVAGTQITVTDPNYALFPNGSWRVEAVLGITCSSSLSRSNIRSLVTAGISESPLSGSMNISPNPAKDFIDIKTDVNNCCVSLMDNMGRLILKKNIQNNTRINLSGFSNGLYFIQLQWDENIINKKIIKE